MRVLGAFTALFLVLGVHTSELPNKDATLQAATGEAIAAVAPVIIGGVAIAAKGSSKFVKRLHANVKKRAELDRAVAAAAKKKNKRVGTPE